MAASPLLIGLRCRCPRCGKGKLFAGFLTVAERCDRCGLDLRKADAGDGPAVFIIFIVGALVMPLAFWLESSLHPPMWIHMAIWPLFVIAMCLLLLRPAKAILIALQFRHRASDSGNLHYD